MFFAITLNWPGRADSITPWEEGPLDPSSSHRREMVKSKSENTCSMFDPPAIREESWRRDNDQCQCAELKVCAYERKTVRRNKKNDRSASISMVNSVKDFRVYYLFFHSLIVENLDFGMSFQSVKNRLRFLLHFWQFYARSYHYSM